MPVVIQARMGSKRLPGKVLRPICGKPLLEYLLERLDQCESIQTVVATSTQSHDDPIAEYCRHRQVTCMRGSENDVADRFLCCAQQFGFDKFVRLSADSPLLDVTIVDRCVLRFSESRCELATNVMPRSFPKGQSAEVLRTSSLSRAYKMMHDAEDLEHVTKFFYKNTHLFHIENVESEVSYDGINLVVDTEQDMRQIDAMIRKMTKPHWEYGLDEVVQLHRSTTCDATPV